MPTNVLLREPVDYPIDATGVHMFHARLRLQHILAEEVVFARYDPVMLNIDDLLREVLSFTIRIEA